MKKFLFKNFTRLACLFLLTFNPITTVFAMITLVDDSNDNLTVDVHFTCGNKEHSFGILFASHGTHELNYSSFSQCRGANDIYLTKIKAWYSDYAFYECAINLPFNAYQNATVSLRHNGPIGECATSHD